MSFIVMSPPRVPSTFGSCGTRHPAARARMMGKVTDINILLKLHLLTLHFTSVIKYSLTCVCTLT